MRAIFSLVLFLAACGGGGSDTPTPPPQPPVTPPNLNHPVTTVNNTFVLTAGEFTFNGVQHIGYEGNALNLGTITATPTFGQLSTFHFQSDSQPPGTHIMFFGQVLANGVWQSVTVTADDGRSVTLLAADAKFTQSPLNADGTPNANTATFWSFAGNPFNLVGGRSYTVTFR